MDSSIVHRSWRISYWIIGALIIIMVFSLLPLEDAFSKGPKVGIVEIKDTITDAKNIVEKLNYFLEKSSISAIVIRLETPGGGVAASQEIYEKVKKISEKNSKPIIASMGGMAASGGYYIALGADTIIANPGSATGSIGVIMTYPIVEELMNKLGIGQETIKSTILKDAGSVFKELNDKERKYFQKLIDDLHNQFVTTVSIERKISFSNAYELSTGEIYSGSQALKNGLIDMLGTLEDAVLLAAQKSGLSGRPIIVYPPKEKKGLLNILFGNMFHGTSLSNLNLYPQLEYKINYQVK